mmetsp:Transcript_72976/g.188247  ORF Transcript_72976/g.188247 Transcript_72976/m.188247 type:complete len:358 (-) Transcript_72976:62-1135(-)
MLRTTEQVAQQRRPRARRRAYLGCGVLAAACLARVLPWGLVPPIRRVLVVGATHGNELTGAWVCQRIAHAPEIASRPSLSSVETVIGNPQGYRETRRFVDLDLNRQFVVDDLADLSLTEYEHQRAKVLDARYGPKNSSSPAVDFAIDCHTTTTSMGITFITEPWSEVGLAAACWCQRRLQQLLTGPDAPEIHIVMESFEKQESPHLISLAREGLMIEIGPIPQGVLRHDICTWMELSISSVMDFLEGLNTGAVEIPARASIFRDANIKVPAPTGPDCKPTAVFHRDFQGTDFRPLRKGDPMFVGIDGEVITYDGAHGDTVWPVFVNEGAYYLPESGLGFAIAMQAEVEVPRVEVADE